MSSYIEITQNTTFPSASNANKLVIGVNDNDKVILTDHNGITSVVTGSINYTPSYKMYTAKLTTEYPGSYSSISLGPTTAGVIYEIRDTSDGDFSNIGAPNNNDGTFFVSTGGTPTSYGSATLQYNTEVPSAIVQENTLGFLPLWELISNSKFGFYFSGSFDPTKVIASISPNSTDNILSYFVVPGSHDVTFFVRTGENNPGILTQTSIEIRQYL